MAGNYGLVKLGKAYVLFYGDTKVTVPPAIHNNGLLELHDAIVTTEDGEAYEIKERNGQITFEKIPTTGVSDARTEDEPPRINMVPGVKKTPDGTEYPDALEAGSEEPPIPVPKKILVTVRRMSERTIHSILLDEDSTIEQLYQTTSKLYGIPVDQIRLLHEGNQLESKDIRKNTLLLLDYSIGDGSVVYLLLRLSGD